MLTVTKRFEFDYAHKLPNYDGNCANLHGHRGVIEVTVRGCPLNYKKTGMVIDFKDLKRIIKPLIEQLDHQYLNNLIENPTAENILLWFLEETKKTELGYHISRIRVYETPDSWVECII